MSDSDFNLNSPVIYQTVGGAAGDATVNGLLTLGEGINIYGLGTYASIPSGTTLINIGTDPVTYLSKQGSSITVGYNLVGLALGGNDTTIDLMTINGVGTFTLQNGIVTKVNGVPTVALGIEPIYAEGHHVAVSTGAVTICSYTVGASDGTFECGGGFYLSAIAAGALQLKAAFTDAESGVTTMALFAINNNTAGGGGTTNGASTGTWNANTLSVRAKAGTTITVETQDVSGSGIVGYGFGYIKQVA